MKKQWILAMTIVLGTSTVFAESFRGEDFNQMIKENQKAENALRNQLQKEAGIKFDDQKPGTIAKDKIIAPSEAEQIVVSSSQPIWREERRKDKPERKRDKADMKRISQELDEALSN